MPNSKLFEYDLTDEKKIIFINNLQRNLNKNGKIYILNIAFSNTKELLECKNNNSEDWDLSEYYIIW